VFQKTTDTDVGSFPCRSPKYSYPAPEVRGGDFPALAPHSRVRRRMLRTRARRVDGQETGQTFLRPGRGACTALWWLDREKADLDLAISGHFLVFKFRVCLGRLD